MGLQLETKLDILKTAIAEDRMEIRLIKDRLYSICTFVPASSFAVTAFLWERRIEMRWFAILCDISFLALLWALFTRLWIDLKNARICLEGREDLLRDIQKKDSPSAGNEVFDPYPPMSFGAKPRIKEKEIFWIVCTVSAALLLKLAFVCALPSVAKPDCPPCGLHTAVNTTP